MFVCGLLVVVVCLNCCVLFVVRCSTIVVRCLLLVFCWLVLDVRGSLFVVCCMLFVDRCLVFVVCCLLLGVRRVLAFVCWLLSNDICCLLLVICWLVFGLRCVVLDVVLVCVARCVSFVVCGLFVVVSCCCALSCV